MRREKSAERASKALFIVANGDIAGGRCGAIARCSAKRPTIGPANMSTQSIGRHTKKNVPPGRVSAARGRSSSITLRADVYGRRASVLPALTCGMHSGVLRDLNFTTNNGGPKTATSPLAAPLQVPALGTVGPRSKAKVQQGLIACFSGNIFV